jgi:hypothetical protein
MGYYSFGTKQRVFALQKRTLDVWINFWRGAAIREFSFEERIFLRDHQPAGKTRVTVSAHQAPVSV